MFSDDVTLIASSHSDGPLRHPASTAFVWFAFGCAGAANDDRREFSLPAWDSLTAADRAAIAAAVATRRPHRTRS
jgi:hypothetical protein